VTGCSLRVNHGFLHITAAEYRENYRVWLRFNNGIAGVVDLESTLTSAMFAPLCILPAFQTVRFDPDAHTSLPGQTGPI